MTERLRLSVVSGSCLETDPRHDLAETSAAFARATDCDFAAEVVDVEDFGRGHGQDVAMLVQNLSGDPEREGEPSSACERVLRFHRSGRPILALHSSVLGFGRHPQWDVTIVHGPARDKIDNRIELLHTLEATGGRRA